MKMKNIYYISYFIQISTYQIIKDPCNEKQVNITYQVMGRQQITQNIIHENLYRKIYSNILDYLTEFRQPLQVQSHQEMQGILVQLGHIQHS